MKNFQNTLLQITQYGMGSGDEALGMLLLANYLKLLNEETELPKFIALYNGGVKLVCKPSAVIQELKSLEQRGVKILSCKTCLNHYNLINIVEVGIVASMVDILELQKLTDKVINL